MPTPHAKFRLGPDTLAALQRIAKQISALRNGKGVTTADVIRWMAALHDPLKNSGREPTREELIGFPTVYPPEIVRAATSALAARTPATGPGDPARTTPDE